MLAGEAKSGANGALHPPPPEAVAGHHSSNNGSNSSSKPQMLPCCLGAAPVSSSEGSAHAMPTQALSELKHFEIAMWPREHGRCQWHEHRCDAASGHWRSYLLLLSESADLDDAEVLFPNKILHGGRALFNATPAHTLLFLADPCLSEVRGQGDTDC